MVNNINIMHARTSFKDGDTPNTRRHLARLWLVCKGANPLPRHLDFPRSYSLTSFPPERRQQDGLLRPQPSLFHVPLSTGQAA